MSARATLYLDFAGEYRWVRKAANGRVVAASSEGYINEIDARSNYYAVNGPDAPDLEIGDSVLEKNGHDIGGEG